MSSEPAIEPALHDRQTGVRLSKAPLDNLCGPPWGSAGFAGMLHEAKLIEQPRRHSCIRAAAALLHKGVSGIPHMCFYICLSYKLPVPLNHP